MADATIESAVERFIADVEGLTAMLSIKDYQEALRRVEEICAKRLQDMGADEED